MDTKQPPIGSDNRVDEQQQTIELFGAQLDRATSCTEEPDDRSAVAEDDGKQPASEPGGRMRNSDDVETKEDENPERS